MARGDLGNPPFSPADWAHVKKPLKELKSHPIFKKNSYNFHRHYCFSNNTVTCLQIFVMKTTRNYEQYAVIKTVAISNFYYRYENVRKLQAPGR